MPINNRMDKYIEMNPHKGILYTNGNEFSTTELHKYLLIFNLFPLYRGGV